MLRLLLCAALAAGAPSAEECLALGFSGDLACSTCDLVDSHLESAAVTADCRKCCTASTAVTYARAKLEIDKRLLSSYPEIESFIATRAGDIANLKVKYRNGVFPRISLHDEHGKRQKVEAVKAWKLDDLSEFLGTVLR